MDGNGSIRVFLLDDHEVVRRGVHHLLSGGREGGDGSGIEIVGEAANAAEAMAGIPAVHPDVALLDVRLPDASGVEVCRDIRSHDPSVKCLMLTSYADEEAVFDAVMAGASGYVPKVIRGDELTAAVRAVATGKSLLDPSAAREVLERLRKGGTRAGAATGPGGEAEAPGAAPGREGRSGAAGLTDVERRTLDLIGEGLTNLQIGERLGLTEKAVKKQVASLLTKLGMEPRSPLADVYTTRTHGGGGGGGDASHGEH